MVPNSIASLQDPRLVDLIRVGGGEGFGLYTASFEGQPVVLANCTTFSDFFEDEAPDRLPVKVMVFESEAARASYLASRGFLLFESVSEDPSSFITDPASVSRNYHRSVTAEPPPPCRV